MRVTQTLPQLVPTPTFSRMGLFRLLSYLLLTSTAFADDVRGDCSTSPVLKYFDIRGRAEAIRMAFADHGIEFSDETFTGDAWGKESDDGLKAQWTMQGKLPFGQVPLLEIDGLALVQSHSILRYLGRKFGWYSGQPSELFKIDLVADGTEDVRKRLGAIRYADISDDEKAKKYEHYFTDAAEGKRWLGFLDNLVGASKTDFASGSAVATHADYLLLDLLDLHDSLGGVLSKTLLATMPALTAWRTRMVERPKLKAYLESAARRKS